MALPAVLFFLINNYLPLLGTFIAFKKIDYRKGLWGSDWVGWENFKYLFSTKDMWIITRNTILYNLAFIVVGIMFSVLLALMLNEISGKIAPKFYQTSIIVPSMVSAAIVGYCVFAFLSPTSGFLTKALEQFGIGKINWYLDPKPWPIILIVVYIWKNCGYNSIVYLASIVGIDKSFYVSFSCKTAGFEYFLLSIAVLMGNCASSMIWVVYCPSLSDTGMVSTTTGYLDFISYAAASVSNIFFGNAVAKIGWGRLILVWAALMGIGAVAVISTKRGRKLG